MKRILLLSTLLSITSNLYSQSINDNKFAVRNRLSGGFDIQLAAKKGYFNPSVSYYELTSVTKNSKLMIGWTATINSFNGRDLNYYTAPARLIRVGNIDTVSFDRQTQTSFNLGVRAELNLGRVQFGTRADLVGLVLIGSSQIGRMYSATGLFEQIDPLGGKVQKPFKGEDAFQQTHSNRFNLRLWGDRDQGMLTTEVYVRAYLLSNAALKVGYQWQSTEIKIDNRDIVANNDRFRNRVGLPYISITIPLSPW